MLDLAVDVDQELERRVELEGARTGVEVLQLVVEAFRVLNELLQDEVELREVVTETLELRTDDEVQDHETLDLDAELNLLGVGIAAGVGVLDEELAWLEELCVAELETKEVDADTD